MQIGAAAQAVVDMISDAGVQATIDGRDLELPGALVAPETISAMKKFLPHVTLWKTRFQQLRNLAQLLLKSQRLQQLWVWHGLLC